MAQCPPSDKVWRLKAIFPRSIAQKSLLPQKMQRGKEKGSHFFVAIEQENHKQNVHFSSFFLTLETYSKTQVPGSRSYG